MARSALASTLRGPTQIQPVCCPAVRVEILRACSVPSYVSRDVHRFAVRDNKGVPPVNYRPRSYRIQELDRLLEHDPDAIELRFERAGLLREQGCFEEAKRDYLELLRRRPTHFGALNDFGTLVLNAGFRSAARTLFGEAVKHHPDNPIGHVNLANFLYLVGEQAEARVHFEAALRIDPDHLHAHRGLSNVLAEIGDRAGARLHRDKGFKDQFLTPLPYHGDRPPISVLLLVSAVGGNVPTNSLIDNHYFKTIVLAAEYYDPNVPLPSHDLVFNSIGDADLCHEGLEAACSIVARTSRPVINHPLAVLRTGRVSNAERLRGLPNVLVPRMAEFPRRLLAGPDGVAAIESNGFAFPLLVRAPGFHTGRHFVRVESAHELSAAAMDLPEDSLWIIEQLDARGRDGKFRKCRVMIIDQRLYPLHLAISNHWKVHYFTAQMAESAEHRSEDAEFLEDMANVVGPPGVAALERICKTLALDYGGIDFAVNCEGDILFFEANATMIVPPPVADPKWSYRRPAVERVLSAVRGMLTDRVVGSNSCRFRSN